MPGLQDVVWRLRRGWPRQNGSAQAVTLESGMHQDEVRGFERSQVWIERCKIRLNETETSSLLVVPLRDTFLGDVLRHRFAFLFTQ